MASPLVPVIDFSPFLVGNAAEKEACAQELLAAMKDVGFVMLKGFELKTPKAVVDEAFTQTKAFFDLPREVKDGLAWTSPESNRGYVSQGRERVTQATDAEEIEKLRAQAPDFKETMEIGKDFDSVWPNLWPKEELPAFQPFMNAFFLSCHRLQVEVMRALALALGIGENFFDATTSKMAHNLRLLNYPSIEKGILEGGGSRAGSHSDYGGLTLLFQDAVGGLEVQDKTGAFVPASPVPDTVVVNIGDLLQRYSNDVLKSTIHRVVLPAPVEGTKGPAMTPRRNSIAFFSNFNLDQIIEALPGTGEAKYEPVESETYLVGRLTATYL